MTDKYVLFGNPVAHSMSPALHAFLLKKPTKLSNTVVSWLKTAASSNVLMNFLKTVDWVAILPCHVS